MTRSSSEGVTWRVCAVAVRLWLAAVGVGIVVCRAAEPEAVATGPLTPLRSRLPAVERHWEGITPEELHDQLDLSGHHRQLVREQDSGRWFAALVSQVPGQRNRIEGRFETEQGWWEFLAEEEAVVDLWTLEVREPDGMGPAQRRRLTAAEIAGWRSSDRVVPTEVTVTVRSREGGPPVVHGVEFSFDAATKSAERLVRYRRDRAIRRRLHEVLQAKGTDGRIGAMSQWLALREAVTAGEIPAEVLPPPPASETDPYVAFEYSVDADGFLDRLVRVYRVSGVRRRVEGGVVRLGLSPPWGGGEVEARAFGRVGLTDLLEPVPAPIPGRDAVQLRVMDVRGTDARSWNAVEFGAPEVIQQTALATFGLINAHTDRQRKLRAWEKSRYDLFAEPLFAAMNIAAGVSGAAVPIGEAARVPYTLTVGHWFLPRSPTSAQLRELFLLLASHKTDPDLQTRPANLLTEEDFKRLRERMSRMTEEEALEVLSGIGEDDLKAMVALARFLRMDSEYRWFVDLLSSVAKATGEADSGVLQALFNSPYYSLAGEISIKNLIAAAAGADEVIPGKTTGLDQLVRGEGPAKAWLQFFDLSVDVRAIANTVAQVSRRNLADRELRRPFPYAPRLTDLAAYEVRIFGYPLLMFHKRGLLKDDMEAFDRDYAYGLLGTRVVEHFATREEMESEILAGRMFPLGYVRVRDASGRLRDSNLAVFAHRIPAGRHRGRLSLVIYGLKAYADYSAVIERERRRFDEFLRALELGAVIERVTGLGPGVTLASEAREPRIGVGPEAQATRYAGLLGRLIEVTRLQRLRSWGGAGAAADEDRLSNLTAQLEREGVWRDAETGRIPVEVDRFGSTFRYRRREAGGWSEVEVGLIPSVADIARDVQRAEEGRELAEARRAALAGRTAGLMMVHEALPAEEGGWRLGAVLRDATGRLEGAGLLTLSGGAADAGDPLARLSPIDRVRLEDNRYAATLVEGSGVSFGGGGKVFVSVVFPSDPGAGVARVDPETGLVTVRFYREGRCEREASAYWVTVFERDEWGQEMVARTYANLGSAAAPVQGALLEESITVEQWLRPAAVGAVDATHPRRVKVRLDHVTGDVRREVYGVWAHPLSVSDEHRITTNRFSPLGRWAGADVFDNGANEADFARERLDAVLHPSPGGQRLLWLPVGPAGTAGPSPLLVVESRDLLTGLVRTGWVDRVRGGRVTGELFVDTLDSSRSFRVLTTNEYRDDFLAGRVPSRTVVREESTGSQLSESTVVSLDPLTRRRVAYLTDYTGNSVTNTWEGGLEEPIRVEGPWRRTEFARDRSGLTYSGRVTDADSGEELGVMAGRFDQAAGRWEVLQTWFHRPGVTNRVETVFRSPSGRWLFTRLGGELEIVPGYGPTGLPVEVETFRLNPASNAREERVRRESEIRFDRGFQELLTVTEVGGQVHDRFRVRRDPVGRTIRDGVREFPGFSLATEMTYDSGSDRMVEARESLNGNLRSVRTEGTPVVQGDGRVLLPVMVRSRGDLVTTQWWSLGGGISLPVETVGASGDRSRVLEWQPGTAQARLTETMDRHARVFERSEWSPGPDAATGSGLPEDAVRRQAVGPWGMTGAATTDMYLRGTDLVLRRLTEEEETVLSAVDGQMRPRYTVDRTKTMGRRFSLDGLLRSNVTALLRVREVSAGAGAPPAAVQMIDRVDLGGFFRYPVSRQWLDANGRVLEERTGTLPALGLRPPLEVSAIESELDRFQPDRVHAFQYEPGFLVEAAGELGAGRTFVFTNRTSAGTGLTHPVNDEGRREFVTGVETRELPPPAATGATDGTPSLLRQRRTQPRRLENNPFQPDAAGLWTAWTEYELDGSGSELVRTDMILDELGRVRASRVGKRTDDGAPAAKTTYHVVPSRAGWGAASLARDRPALVASEGITNVSGADFVYCELRGATNTSYALRLTDQRGRTVETGAGGLRLWETGGRQVLWLPSPVVPAYGASVTASASSSTQTRLLVVAVPALNSAEFDTSRLTRVEILSTANGEESLEISRLQRLQGGAPGVEWRRPDTVTLSSWQIPGGVTARQWKRRVQTDFEAEIGAGVASEITFGRLPVVLTRESRVDPVHSDLIVVDASRDGVVRPLYAVSSRDGRLVEHYRVEELTGATRLYRIGQGFQAPAFEVHDHRILGDEISPGFVAYGYNYHVPVQYARADGFLQERLAALRNRIAANAFAYYGRRAWEEVAGGGGRRSAAALEYRELHGAQQQSAAIASLPTLAEGLSPLRGLPWEGQEVAVPEAAMPVVDRKQLRTNLLELHVHRFASNRTTFYQATYLIPPSPGDRTNAAAPDRYVDTVQEARIIELAVDLGELGLARDLLAFYAGKSEFGRRPVHASYDAETGTAMVEELGYRRAMQSRETAEAQVAMAAAALHYAVRSGDRGGLVLASNLVDLIVGGRPHDDIPPFRSVEARRGRPRGISHYPAREPRRVASVRLWPEPARYPVGVNARFLLLLRRLEREVAREGNIGWQADLERAREEQERWFRTHLLPAVESTGVVPSGLFEIQDINGGDTAPGLERWTSAGDWLDFLEAARELLVPDTTLRGWLENLARVHAATVDGVSGLDWSLPLNRPPALSAELTARFARVATLLGHTAAANWASANLARWPKGAWEQATGFASVVTTVPADRRLKTGQGMSLSPAGGGRGWPESLLVYRELGAGAGSGTEATIRAGGIWDGGLSNASPAAGDRGGLTDVRVFVLIAAVFYVSILVTAVGWWALRRARRSRPPRLVEERVVPDAVMQLAEERWAKRILGVLTPAGAEHTRYSNSVLEPNFLMQLRAIYKLVAEWRRVENGWEENDRRLTEDESDPWLNGMDEYVCLVGIYMRFVIKAGAKDGSQRKDPLEEAEDSNHIWSRLVMFFSEYYWGLFGLMRDYGNLVTTDQRTGMYADIAHLLTDMGVRERPSGFDARRLLNHPASPGAFDLLSVQKPGTSLKKVLLEAATRLQVPYTHIVRIIERYKAFKRRESPDPVHPYLIEFAKCLPHFVLMGLGALVQYNQNTLGDSPLVPYLGSVAADLLQPGQSLFWLWALPLLGGMLLSLAAHFVSTYRFEGSMLHRDRPGFIFDATLTSLMGRKYAALPAARSEWWWDPRFYEWPGWLLRCAGFLSLAGILLTRDTPSFATFLVVKGLFAVIALAEVAAVVGPLSMSWVSRWLQDRVLRSSTPSGLLKFLNRLNLTVTRPASPLALSLRYHMQASAPSADARGMLQAIGFFFLMSATFFFTGGFLCQQIFPLWFTEMYLNDANGKLFLGSLVFWNTMYLLRYGLFLLFTSLASFAATFPMRAVAGAGALLYAGGLSPLGSDDVRVALGSPTAWLPLAVVFAVLVIFEEPLLAAWRRRIANRRSRGGVTPETLEPALERIRANASVRLGLVYMSGDDLGYQKLTADLLMTRWRLLRERYGSEGLALLSDLAGNPSDDQVRSWFTELYELEKRQGVTLWHPVQVVVAGETARFSADSGLNLEVADAAARSRIHIAWHLRRWLVTMMSSAGHSQDTAVTLVDVALRLNREGLADKSVFYLIQNKYDDRDDNRPSQLAYGSGELAQRNKLARLLEALAPGARAWSVQNWTPFGFKAGGMTGMDLVHEEALRLSTMVVMDRNATVHDLDALMVDLARAMEDPDLVILIPGRGTTNTLTELGQASQLIEEGHRSFLKGLMSVLGGSASESVGTGWGNIVTCTYGRVQRAMMDPITPRMPLTSRMQRGANFAYKTEGLIGFTPHAVGISEDTWAVSQAAHNLVALGGRVKFGLSGAFWHKIRETWSHAEWLASFPRWSGGYLQMMHDPIMQRINDFGPLSVFAREIRSHSGRAFLSAPFSLANVLLLPLAILFGVTPFVQILIILWNFGFVMNQVLTLHGLNVYLESAGFRRWPGLLGAIAGVALGLVLKLPAGWIAVAAPAGALYGGFFAGFHRWLFTRVRDAILFGPQLVLHTLGQLMRQTIEFVTSGAAATDPQGVNMQFRAGAGPREDQPLNPFPHFINLRTVVWCVGLPSVLFILLALSELDMFNVVLLLPSLLFTVSVLIGPFLMPPRPGAYNGARVVLPRLAAWPVALLFYGTVSLLVASGSLGGWLGLLLFLVGFSLVLRSPAGALLFRARLAIARRALERLLVTRNVSPPQAAGVARDLVRVSGDAARQGERLTQAGVASGDQVEVLQWIGRRVQPLVQEPGRAPKPGSWAACRGFSDFGRALVLALFVLLWFLVVPVPGLFVLSAGEYQVSLLLEDLIRAVGIGLMVCIPGYWLARFLETRVLASTGPGALRGRARRLFQELEEHLPQLAADDSARRHALLMDFQTYLDQRSPAYAERVLRQLEIRERSSSG